jgi:hypothetical protein
MLLLLGGAILSNSCVEEQGDEEDDFAIEPQGEGEARSIAADSGTASVVPYIHPLRESRAVGGLRPFVDTNDSPDGRRYGIEEGVEIDETGEVRRVSGIFEYEVRETTTAELERMRRVKLPPVAAAPSPLMSPRMLEYVRSGGTEPVTVLMRVREPDIPGLQAQLNALTASGEIRSQADHEAWERRLIGERQSAVQTAQAPVIEAITAVGGDVLTTYENLFGLDARLTPAMVLALAEHPDVVRMDLDVQAVQSAEIMGTLVAAGTQIQQFIDDGNDGEFGSDVHAAIVDLDDYHDEHPGFKETSAAGTRIAGKFTCGASCVSVVNFPVPGIAHSTWVAGLVLGDLRDAQDPAYPGAATVAQSDRSGYAGEARGYFYKLSPGFASSARRAFDHIITVSPKPRIVALAAGFPTDDDQCLGESPLNMDANDLFENGQLLIASAGNTGHAVTTDCTVLSPASAIGAFAVGGHGNSDMGLESDVRTATIYTDSPFGGASASEGKSRTIIDVTAYAPRRKLFDTAGGYTIFSTGTSVSGPTVAGSAIDYNDFFKTANAGSTTIDQPGSMAVSLLLMGDRQSRVGGKLTFGYDPLWGAGRLKMRKADAGGLDAPAIWKIGSACIEQNETFTVPINTGLALSNTVNDFKAAIYWYDRRHELGTAIDDIDLYLRTTALTDLEYSTSTSDEKERVYHGAIGGNAIQLDIVGYDVTADNEGCGANSMLVYWSYFYEDDARDDPDGPTLAEIERE